MINLIKAFRQKTRHYISDLKMRAYIEDHFPGTVIEEGVQIKGELEHLKLGKKVIIQKGTAINLGGFEWCQNTGWLEIGDYSVLSPYCVVYAAGPGGIRIGQNFDCGPGVGIFASRSDYIMGSSAGTERHIFEPVQIGDGVIIFSNAVISPGVTVGDGAVIAACAAVTKSVPPNSMVGGTPAKIIRQSVRPQPSRPSS